jgi:hypothetical protein
MGVDKKQIEHQLIGRLKILGWMLLGFSLVAFVYSFFPEAEETEEELVAEFSEPPPLNMIVVTVALASVGAGCVAIAWKKKTDLFRN